MKVLLICACFNQDDDENSKFPSPKKRRNPVSNDSLSVPRNRDECARKGPTWEDFIIAYSTIPGYVSNRDPEKGTW